MDDRALGLPKDFLERLPRIVPADQLENVLRAFVQRPTTFRVNTLKTDRDALLAQLAERGFQTAPVAWYANAFVLQNRSKQALLETPMYANGELYVQGLSSMLPPLVLQPKPGDKVCDLAAAPGSKTTQMAAMMNNRGEIVANDRSRPRLYKLAANLKTLGVTNVKTTRYAGELLWKYYPEYFDKTLVDAPCSLEGRFDVADPKSFKDWSVRKTQTLGILQRHLLRSAVSATKPGGVIVYSTCTLAPEENEKVIDWLLDKERGVVEIEAVGLKMGGLQPGLARWERKEFSPRVRETSRILPSKVLEGFYVAKLRKKRSNVK